MKDILKRIEYLKRDGFLDTEIRKRLNISARKFSVIKKENPQLFLPDMTDYQVEDALLKRALGFRYAEVREVEKPNGTEVTTTYKEVPPDVTAATTWLKNRKSDKWREKQEDSDGNSKVIEMIKRIDESAAEHASSNKKFEEKA